MSAPHAARGPCEHYWISKHQPDMPIYWIDQCSLCGDFNAERIREQMKRTSRFWRMVSWVGRRRAP